MIPALRRLRGKKITIQHQPGLDNEFQAGLDYIARFCLTNLDKKIFLKKGEGCKIGIERV